MLDLSAQHFLFGDPMIKTTYKIDDAPTIPYDSVIKPYCDAGPQRYKRYGPCLDLSGAAVNGNIYRKSVKEVTFYEQTSGTPDESVLEEECYEEARRRGITDASRWDYSGWPKGCFILIDVDDVVIPIRWNTLGTAACSNTNRCIQKDTTNSITDREAVTRNIHELLQLKTKASALDVAVQDDVYIEHDSVILVHKNGNYSEVHLAIGAVQYYSPDRSNPICDSWEESVPREECEHAASELGFTYNELSLSNTGTHVKSGCFLDGTVLFYFDNIYKEGNYRTVSSYSYVGRNFICKRAVKHTFDKSDFQLYVNTSTEGAAQLAAFDSPDSNIYRPYEGNQGLNENKRVGAVEPGFMHMRPQTKNTTIGACMPTGATNYGSLGTCEDIELGTDIDEGYAPSCTCPPGYSNAKYSDYNQPWSNHASCNTLEGDSGELISYKPCFGPGSCTFETTPFAVVLMQ